MQSMVRLPGTAHNHCLSKFVDDSKNHRSFSKGELTELQELAGCLKIAMDNLTSKRPLFEGAYAPINAMLSEFQGRVVDLDEDVDLTTVLYEGFWSLLRAGNLPYLDITPTSSLGICNASQLTCLGIRSNRDLECLGISGELQKRVDTLILDIEKLVPISQVSVAIGIGSAAQEEQETVRSLWEKCTLIRLEEVDIKSTCEKIVELIKIEENKNLQLGRIYLELCEKLLTFPHLSVEDAAIVKRRVLTFEVQDRVTPSRRRKKRKVSPSLDELFVEALIILRKQHPLFCLQRYLTVNQYLKQAWEFFQTQGQSSIKDLIGQKVVKEPADLLRLSELARFPEVAI